MDKAANAKPLNFQVALPSKWNERSVQVGGGGMNGSIPGLTGSQLTQGYVIYGSDSGHQAGGARGTAGPNPVNDWALNDEAIRNLGYMQMKKTRDAAIVLIGRIYGGKPRYNYYLGSSQGGREAAEAHFVGSRQGELSQRKALVGRLAIPLQCQFGIPRHPEAPGIERSQMRLPGRVLGGGGAFKPGDRPLLVFRDPQPSAYK